MRKLQKILLGTFLGGILLGGIGTGIAFVEYSSITYAGERVIGADSMVTKDLDFTFDAEKGIVNVEPVWYDGGKVSYVELDETVPEGIVRYRLTYNEKTVSPHIHFAEYEEDWKEEDGQPETDFAEENSTEPEDSTEPENSTEPEDSTESEIKQDPVHDQGTLYLEQNYHDDFGLWMENKDEILSDLKRGRIASYRSENITEVKVLVNPGSKAFIKQTR